MQQTLTEEQRLQQEIIAIKIESFDQSRDARAQIMTQQKNLEQASTVINEIMKAVGVTPQEFMKDHNSLILTVKSLAEQCATPNESS